MTLTSISTPTLASILDAIERGRLVTPLSRAALLSEGYAGSVDALLAVAAGMSREAVSALLRVAIAERTARPPPHLDLVWTGPEARVATARDTAVLVSELFASARRHVLIAGFSFDHGDRILAPLHAAMRDHGVLTDIFIDFVAGSQVAAAVTRFLTRNWTMGPPYPRLQYDPRTLDPNERASLHAKCIVVDGRRTLITSANFTDRGHSRNVELGVLIDDPEFGARVVAQWRALVDEGVFVAAPIA